MSLDSMHKMLQNFNKKFARFKRECGKIADVLENARDLFNESYYLYKIIWRRKRCFR